MSALVAQEINATLAREAPAVWRCLSPLGRDAVFPHGIPAQAQEASSAPFNATIGQYLRDDGQPDPVPEAATCFAADLDPKLTWLYAPMGGPPALSQAWRAWQASLAGPTPVAANLPIAAHGLTHALSLVGLLFLDEDTDLILPEEHWEAYRLVLGLSTRARLVTYPFFREGRFNVEGLADRLAEARKKAAVVLNFPSNPTGYSPTVAEVGELKRVLARPPVPTVVITDDAYQGFVYDDAATRRSVWWDLQEVADPERVALFKVDGATKELLFFSSRVAFVTTALPASAAEALASKWKMAIRCQVGPISGPAAAAVLRALQQPTLSASFEARRQVLAGRWASLRQAYQEILSPALARVEPFNGAFFSLIRPAAPDVERLRLELLQREGVGVVALPEVNALRVAFCSLPAERLPELVERLARGLRRATGG
jgi:aspartate/methionine/tyrosine aminotransferase